MRIDGVEVRGPITREFKRIITPDSIRFAANLEREFGERLRELRQARSTYQSEIDSGKWPQFPPQTDDILNGNWQVAPIPTDLQRRWVEITGPASDRKMVINALNSGADVYMADSEDSESPAWENIINGQINLKDVVDRTITFTTSKKHYKLEDKVATLAYRPRGLHLDEVHVLVDEEPMSASLFDFAMYYYHNARGLVERGSGPYPYLPKAEHYKESAWWNDVIDFSEERLNLKGKPTRATQLIETYPAAFQMPLMLHALREHSGGLNLGRWDLWFSTIKTLMVLAVNEGIVFPGRAKLTMSEHFPKAACDLLVKTCHLHGAHAMGGMSAIVPDKESEAVLEKAIEAIEQDKLDDFMTNYKNTWVAGIIEDKLREAAIHFFDGAWAAHPGMVKLIGTIFKKVLNGRPNQIDNKRQGVIVTPLDLKTMPRGEITEADLRENINIPIQYLESWLRKTGCVAISKKMEDLATAEMGRILVSHWLEQKAKLNDGRSITIQFVKQLIREELAAIKKTVGDDRYNSGKYKLAAELLEGIVNKREVTKFLGDVAYPYVTSVQKREVPESKEEFVERVTNEWKNNPRWEGIVRPYSPEDVYKLRGTVHREYTIAKNGANKLWELLHEDEPTRALSAVTGNQAIEEVQAGLKSVYVSGWQVAGDMNNSLQMYPDQSLYTSDSVPTLVKRINNSLMRADQITHLEENHKIDWMVPLVADAEAGFGDKLHSFEIMKQMIEAGASGVHFEDQLASVKKCGHLGGKVIVPTKEFIDKLISARLASDVCGVNTLLIARTDAGSGSLLTNDIDENDKPFIICDGEGRPKRTSEGFYMVKAGLDQAISRGLAYAPYADILWMETSTPDLEEARKFAEAIHAKFPGKLLAYNCSPSFNWRANFTSKILNRYGIKLSAKEIAGMGYEKVKGLVDSSLPQIGYQKVENEVNQEIASFQEELGKMGYKFQFVTLSGFHSLNYGMFELAKAFKENGMLAYSHLQDAEFNAEKDGYNATKHQRFVGTGYFDAVTLVASGGKSSTTALKGSTEAEQFKH